MIIMIEQYLFQFFDEPTFTVATVLFIIGFIIWELPRSIKIMDEEYNDSLYPEMGRVFDIIVLILGLVCIAFLYFMDGLGKVIHFLKYENLFVLFAIIIIAIPVLIFMGYLKRILSRINEHESMTVFLVHNFLDLAHTVFFICFTIIVIPVVLYFLFGWL